MISSFNEGGGGGGGSGGSGQSGGTGVTLISCVLGGSGGRGGKGGTSFICGGGGGAISLILFFCDISCADMIPTVSNIMTFFIL